MYQIEKDLARKVCFYPNFFKPEGAEQLIKYLLSEIHTILPVSYESKRRSCITTFEPMMLVSSWQSRSVLFKGELVYTFVWILKPIWYWSSQLTSEYLHLCCA